MKKNKKTGMQVRIVKERPVSKADTSLQIAPQETVNADEWIMHPVDMRGLNQLVKNSSILPQCIRAYKNNICGYGIGIRYIDDVEETEEMAEEFSKAEEIIELLNTEQDTKEVFEDLIEAREIYGIAYLEVIRDISGNVVQIEFIRDTPSITKTRQLDPYIQTSYYHHGRQTTRRKRYCKYKQEIGGKTVYFKEFGDPRIMDNRSGEYLESGETLELAYQANEIMEFAIGTEPYGEVRWIGQVLGVDGSRKAENLNNNYFVNGRHTPLMIMIEGGSLTDESYEKLQEYMEDIKGEAGQHAFIILEAETTDGRVDFDNPEKPKVEIKELASILQKDELFQEYLDNNRRRVQSAFQLPDLYVGYTTDFNRATAQTAQEVTEEQVFQPERKSLAWAINNRLLNGYQFKYVEAYFLEPDVSNPDDLYKLLVAANNAGGVTPNFAKRLIYTAYGEDAEDYPDEWGNTPLSVQQMQAGQGAGMEMQPPQDQAESVTQQLQKQIQKAAASHDDQIVAVMKEVRKLLLKMNPGTNEQSVLTSSANSMIIKEGWDEDVHPRDDNGKFASGGGGSSDSSGESDSSGSQGGGEQSGRPAVPAENSKVTSQEFVKTLDAAKATCDPKDAWRVDTNRSSDDFDSEGIETYATKGGSTFAIKPDGDIVSVCKNQNEKTADGERFNAKDLMAAAVERGGTHLDSYSGNYGFYVKCGFEAVSRCAFDEQYAPPGWTKGRDDAEDIYFMRYVGVGNVQDKDENAMKERVPYSSDYETAAKILEDMMKGETNG